MIAFDAHEGDSSRFITHCYLRYLYAKHSRFQSIKHFLDRTSQFQYRSGTNRTASRSCLVRRLLKNAGFYKAFDSSYQVLGRIMFHRTIGLN